MQGDRHCDVFDAVRSNELERARSLLEVDRSLANARILGEATLLSEQVWQNKTQIDVYAEEIRDTPALHHAVFHRNVERAKLLLAYGADVHALGYENNHEMTPPIVLAACDGGIDMLRLLLAPGAAPNATPLSNVTPLATALRHGKTDCVELLRLHGAVGRAASESNLVRRGPVNGAPSGQTEPH